MADVQELLKQIKESREAYDKFLKEQETKKPAAKPAKKTPKKEA